MGNAVNEVSEPGSAGKKKPRRAVMVSPQDEALLAKGLKPSWCAGAEPSLSGDSTQQTGNDQRLLEDVPPHWVPPK